MLTLVLMACETVRKDLNQGIKSGIIYKRDMRVCVDGKCAEGVIAVSKKESYKFEVKSYGNLDLFTFSTCHREDTTQQFSTKKRWYGSKGNRKTEGVYKPAPGLEDQYSCPAYIGGWDAKGRHSWAFVDFETDDLTLGARLSCNGSQRSRKGNSVCQSKAGLYQLIEFDEPVSMVIPETDECFISNDKAKSFKFMIKKGECVYRFIDDKYNMHRLTTLGYEQIIVRKKD